MPLITPFDPWNSKICTCPPKVSLSAYTGCGHNCLYCYASSYIRDFFSPRAKKDYIKRLHAELKKLPKNSHITIANSSDPYLPLEKEARLTQQTLKILTEYNFRVSLVTKSALIQRDIDIIKDLPRVVVCVSLTTLDTKTAKKLERFASLPNERLKVMDELSKYVPVVCRFDPLIYPLNTGEIKVVVKELKRIGVKQIITSTYKAKPDNFKRMKTAFPEHKKLWDKLYLEQGSRKGNYLYLHSRLRKELIEQVREAALNEELEFSSCREGFSELNTKHCDGSGFF